MLRSLLILFGLVRASDIGAFGADSRSDAGTCAKEDVGICGQSGAHSLLSVASARDRNNRIWPFDDGIEIAEPSPPPLPGIGAKAENGKAKLVLMMDTNYPPYAMWSSESGKPDQLGGIGYDFALEVCKQCDLECVMTVDKWANCWDNDLPGKGLASGYYHGCVTYTNQYQRQWSLEFSESFLRSNKPAGILSRLKPDGTPVISPTSDLSGFKICDVAGWAPTIKTLGYSENDCTNHTLFKNYEVVTPPENGPDAAMRMLLSGGCDAVYMYADMIQSKQQCNGCNWDVSLYTQLGKEYAWIHTGVLEHMANGTTLTMSKKGSGIPKLVNPCIRKALKTRAYFEICEKYNLTQECYPNQYFPKADQEKHSWAMNNLERGAKCSATGDSDHIHAECGCETGYCGCDSVLGRAPE